MNVKNSKDATPEETSRTDVNNSRSSAISDANNSMSVTNRREASHIMDTKNSRNIQKRKKDNNSSIPATSETPTTA
jgi:hypothetical protein